MRHTLKGLTIGPKQTRWPSGYHYVCKEKEKLDYPEFFLDEEEYNAIKAIDDLKLSEDQAKKIAKIIEDFGQFKYETGSSDANEDESL